MGLGVGARSGRGLGLLQPNIVERILRLVDEPLVDARLGVAGGLAWVGGGLGLGLGLGLRVRAGAGAKAKA
eukprot:scaffold59234_cov78-Phaeocystis_antarctica.AAC.3